MNLSIDEEAQEEARSLVAWYQERNPQAAERLTNLFVATVEEIARHPLAYPPAEAWRHSTNVRRARLAGFPIIIVFQVRDDEIYVIAVAHTSRRPGYWSARVRKP